MSEVSGLIEEAVVHHRAGRLAEAEQLYRRVLETAPAHADALHLLGVLAQSAGRADEALDLIGRAIAADSRQASYHFNRAEVYRSLGRRTEARASYEQAVSLQPSHAPAWLNLGTLLQTAGDLMGAEACYRRALKARPNYALALNALGAALLTQGRLQDAEPALREALCLQQDYVEAWNNLGSVLQRKGDRAGARQGFDKALTLRPDHALAHFNLGTLCQVEGDSVGARAGFEHALRLNSDLSAARAKLTEIDLEQGLLDSARANLTRLDPAVGVRVCMQFLESLLFTARIEVYDKVLTLARSVFPENAALEAAALFRLHFDPVVAAPEILRRQREWVRKFYSEAAPLEQPRRRPGDKVRVAYVGTYLHCMFLESVFSCHDYDRFDVTLITDDQRLDYSRQYPRLQVHRFTGTDVVQLCRAREIDLAIDLVGPVPFRNGLAQFAAFQQRLAPVQATWIGTLGTTGSLAYDHIIADWQLLGQAEEELYSERPARLPEVWLCWTPAVWAPEPGPLPARTNGYVTFGSANRGFKMHTGQLRLWAEILTRCPGSRFILKGPPASDPEFLDRLYRAFGERGVAHERIVTSPYAPYPEHLGFYREVDISLDTYPHSGGITTLESLWMGVPVVSRFGRCLTSRFARSHLAHLGCSDWIAASDEEYLDRACALAASLDRLSRERESLRPRLSRSLLCDGPRFTRQLEALYLAMIEGSGKSAVAVADVTTGALTDRGRAR
jgi:predicted O-linked N-acetylglucosamine transferase (SPINDLY family)